MNEYIYEITYRLAKKIHHKTYIDIFTCQWLFKDYAERFAFRGVMDTLNFVKRRSENDGYTFKCLSINRL